MSSLSVRWLILVAVAAAVTLLGAQRYFREVRTVSPAAVASGTTPDATRVMGRVEAGTLTATPDGRNATFALSADGTVIQVNYEGEKPDNLRALKTLVVVGQWDPAARMFRAQAIDLVPNFGFIVASYILTLVPLGVFVFVMERRVKLLYTEIKQSKIYTPEVGALD